MITENQMNELLETIQGSCQTLSEACESLGFSESDLSDNNLEELDATYLQCPSCGWWVEAGDMYDEDSCRDCYEEENDDEE